MKASKLTPAQEEYVIKKRFLNNEKSLRKLYSSISAFMALTPSQDNEETVKKAKEMHKAIIENFANIEYEMVKNNIKLKNIATDHQYYKEKQTNVENDNKTIEKNLKILGAKLKLITKKKNLKLKYNQLGTHVVKLNKVEEMDEMILLKKREFDELNHEYDERMGELEGKQKKLEFVLSSLKNFLIEEDKN